MTLFRFWELGEKLFIASKFAPFGPGSLQQVIPKSVTLPTPQGEHPTPNPKLSTPKPSTLNSCELRVVSLGVERVKGTGLRVCFRDKPTSLKLKIFQPPKPSGLRRKF